MLNGNAGVLHGCKELILSASVAKNAMRNLIDDSFVLECEIADST